MGIKDLFGGGSDEHSIDQKHRRKEASTVRKESAAERKRLKNEKLKQKVKKQEAKDKVRLQNGGTGFKFVFFNKRKKARHKSGKGKTKRR